MAVDSLPAPFSQELEPQWRSALASKLELLGEIENRLKGSEFLPPMEAVLRVFKQPLDQIKVVIFGQDPYPTIGHANGLAFSVETDINPLPKTLQNILKEYESDLGKTFAGGGDLSGWSEQGVALINRTLTVAPGRSNSHLKFGWREFTDEVANILGQRDLVAILWGNNASELSGYFRDEFKIQSPHPSPLSAYRGFFGSKPFTRANVILSELGKEPINW